VEDTGRSDGVCDLPQGNVYGHKCNTYFTAYEGHYRVFDLAEMAQEVGVSGEAKAMAPQASLVDGTCDQGGGLLREE
jgi:hypothetical protein